METTDLTKTKEQVLEIAIANDACQPAIEIYKSFNGNNNEFANQYPIYTLWIYRFIPNFVDKETFLHCCEKEPLVSLLFYGKELLEKHFDFFKELALKKPEYALRNYGIHLCEKHFVLFKELALKDPFAALVHCGNELLEKDYDFFKELALINPINALIYCGKELREKNLDFYQVLKELF